MLINYIFWNSQKFFPLTKWQYLYCWHVIGTFKFIVFDLKEAAMWKSLKKFKELEK